MQYLLDDTNTPNYRISKRDVGGYFSIASIYIICAADINEFIIARILATNTLSATMQEQTD